MADDSPAAKLRGAVCVSGHLLDVSDQQNRAAGASHRLNGRDQIV
ncbi:MAG: hypothetical protein ACU83P_12225 [Gammaproteobacteria bacterium]